MGFLYRELCTAILPDLGLSHVLTHWPEIAQGLAASPRKRTRQRMTDILS